MKKLLLAASIAMFASAASAESVAVVKYPSYACVDIVSAEYSSGGGETMWHYLEILCKDDAGKYTGFTASWKAWSGLFGLGRQAIVDRFEYVPYDGDAMIVEWK